MFKDPLISEFMADLEQARSLLAPNPHDVVLVLMNANTARQFEHPSVGMDYARAFSGVTVQISPYIADGQIIAVTRQEQESRKPQRITRDEWMYAKTADQEPVKPSRKHQPRRRFPIPR